MDRFLLEATRGKQFEYDLAEMRMGKAINHSHDAGVVPPRAPTPPTTKVKYAVLAAVPVALVIGAVSKSKKPDPTKSLQAGNDAFGPAGENAAKPAGK